MDTSHPSATRRWGSSAPTTEGPSRRASGTRNFRALVSALVDDDPEADDPPLFLDSRARRRHRRARAGAPTDSQILATLLTDDPAPGAVRGGTVRLHAPTGTLLLPPACGGLPRRRLVRTAGAALLGALLLVLLVVCSILLIRAGCRLG